MGKRSRKFNRIGVVSIGLLAISATIMMNPIIGARMMLAVGSDTDGNSSSSSSSESNGWDIDLNVGGDEAEASSVTISLGTETSSVTLNAKNPSKLQGMIKKTANVTIGATDGYTIKVSGNPNLASGENAIQGVSSATTLNQMSNRWGWYYSDGNTDCSESASYKGMLSAGETVGSGKLSSTTTKTITMCFGAKIDASQPGGNYSNTVVISAVAQPKSITTFGGIKTMQEMTIDKCVDSSVNDTAHLRDERDGKFYWVTKMRDGNCWMSQNLDLDLGSSVLATRDADPTQTFTWSNSTPTTTSITTGSTSNTGTYSWDLQEYVLNTPTATTACSSNNTGLGACSGQGFVNVAGWTPSTDPNFYRATSYKGTDGSTSCTKTANSAVNSSASGACRIYDAHYLVGNYYQWNAATAGTGEGITDSNASGSVCPKNWKLPSSNATTDGTFAYMLQQYGVQSKVNVAAGAEMSTVGGNNNYDIALSPLFFLRGGRVNPAATNKFHYAGQHGYYWSSRADSSIYTAYSLYFDSRDVGSLKDGHYFGYPLRCIVYTYGCTSSPCSIPKPV